MIIYEFVMMLKISFYLTINSFFFFYFTILINTQSVQVAQ